MFCILKYIPYFCGVKQKKHITNNLKQKTSYENFKFEKR